MLVSTCIRPYDCVREWDMDRKGYVALIRSVVDIARVGEVELELEV